ncbi:MAG: hypothetical protein ACREMK_10435 [Gemmatimonadota bacterium]
MTTLLLLGTGLAAHGQERGQRGAAIQPRPIPVLPQEQRQPQGPAILTRPSAQLDIKHIAHYPSPATEGKSIAFEILVENTGTAQSSGKETLHFDCKNKLAGGPACPLGAGDRKLPVLHPPPAPYATGPQTHSEQLLTQPTWKPGTYEVQAWIQAPGQTRRSEVSRATIQVQGSVAHLDPDAAKAAIAADPGRVPAGRAGQDEKQVDEKAVLACPTCFNPQPEPPGKEEQAAVQRVPDIPVPPGPQPLQPGQPGFNPDPPPPPQPAGLDAAVAKEAVVKMGDQPLPILGIDQEVEVDVGPDKTQWMKDCSTASIAPIKGICHTENLPFRWTTKATEIATSLGGARWFVHASPNTSTPVLAQGFAPVPQPGKMAGFTIDFRPIMGSKQPPLSYWVQVVGYEQARLGERPSELTRSNTIRVDIPGSGGPVTQFTELGLRPELYNAMPMAVQLQSLTVQGEDDIEPYLLVAAVFLDGTTIKPQLNVVAKQITFQSSSVRIANSTQTHKNVAGDQSLSSGQTVTIPSSTGYFETTIRPIGLDLANQFNLSDSQRKPLREQTMVGILAIGLEEDEVPSTSTMNQLWAQAIAEFQAAFDNAIRGVTLNVSDPASMASVQQALVKSLQQSAGPIADRLKKAAIANTIDDLAQYLVIPGFPLIAPLAPLVADDYVGAGVKVISYEQLLNSFNVPFTLNLSGNEPAQYVIQGRAWIK